MKLLFFKGFLGALILVLLLSINLLPAESGSKTIKLEGKPDFAVPLGSSSNLELAMKESGFDMGMLPPIAWSFERESLANFDFTHKLSQGGLLIVEWKTDTDSNYVVYNESILHKTYTVTPSGTGTLKVNVRACSDDVEDIFVEYLGLTSIEVSQLSGLKKLYARDNKLNGIIDLRNSTNLDVCHVLQNNYASANTSGAHSLKILLSQVKELQIYRSNVTDTLNLSTCTNLELAHIHENAITTFIPPNNPTTSNFHTLNAAKNSLTDTLDLSNFKELVSVDLQFNWLDQLKINGLPKLVTFNARNNTLGKVLDFRQSTLLDVCNLLQNNYGTGPSGTSGPHSLKVYLSQVRDLQIYRSNVTDTLDLSSCTNLELAYFHENALTTFFPPNNPTTSNLHTILANNNSLTDTLDISNFKDLATVNLNFNWLDQVKANGLAKLVTFNARNNTLGKVLDFRQSPLLDVCNILQNNYGTGPTGTSGSHSLKVYLNQVRDLQIYRSNVTDTLDLSTCTNLELAYIHENALKTFIPPNNSTTSNLHTLFAYSNSIEGEIDLSDYGNLATIQIQNNKVEKLQVDGLTSLTYFNAGNNQIRDTLDFTSSTSLNQCYAYQNNYGGSTGNWTLTVLLDKVQDLQIYRSKVTGQLDLSTCTGLKFLYARENEISSILLPGTSNKIPITVASVGTNSMDSTAVENFVQGLHDQVALPTSQSGALTISGNTSSYTATTSSLFTSLQNIYSWTVTQ